MKDAHARFETGTLKSLQNLSFCPPYTQYVFVIYPLLAPTVHTVYSHAYNTKHAREHITNKKAYVLRQSWT